jgi:polygalacturonase
LNGNKEAEDSEIHPTKPWLRNNTIDIRAINNLVIENVNAYNARSGVIIASWDCERISIRNSSFHHNSFDGIALYSSRHLLISDFLCYANNAAGLSLDNRLIDVSFSNGSIYENKDVGILRATVTDSIPATS